MEKIIITCYTNPDLDAFACVFAYKEFLVKNGQEAESVFFGTPQDEVEYLLRRFSIPTTENNSKQLDSAAKIILVDSSNLETLDKAINPQNVIEVIDHREVTDVHLFPNTKIQIELVGAAASLITEKYIKQQIDISFESAVLLYGAIISNTLNFKSNTTTERDRIAASWLNKKANLPENFTKKMFLAKSDLAGEKLKKRMEDDFVWINLDNNKKVGTAQIEMIGGKNLVDQRKEEILKELSNLKNEFGLDFIFLSVIELEQGFNLFVADDKTVQKMLSSIFGIEFIDNQAIRQGLITRKEIVPLIKKYLES